MDLNDVSIIGAGTMGRGIAQLLIQNKLRVCLFDKDIDVLNFSYREVNKRITKFEKEKSLETRKPIEEMLSISDNIIEASQNNLIIEAVPEKIILKKELISQIDKYAPTGTIICTNTSGLDIDRIAADTNRSSQIIGLHFFNPPHTMPLVEIARGNHTSDKTFEIVESFAKKIGKTAIEVQNSPGFVVNRILFLMINEAIHVLENGVANARDIDRAMVLGASHPIGPLALADFVGLDVTLDILENLQKDLSHPAFKPSKLLREKVNCGNLGRKTGLGFFSYE
jgi:3-hydroxybutyryl-CoA dehydrogenase